MLRRVARVLQVALFGLGIAGIAWIPLSFFYVVGASASETGPTIVSVDDGRIYWVISRVTNPLVVPIHAYVRPHGDGVDTRGLLWPRYYDIRARYSVRQVILIIPLWLLAAICLAWPVTSLLLARRRRKGRGFAVERAADAAPPAIDRAAE